MKKSLIKCTNPSTSLTVLIAGLAIVLTSFLYANSAHAQQGRYYNDRHYDNDRPHRRPDRDRRRGNIGVSIDIGNVIDRVREREERYEDDYERPRQRRPRYKPKKKVRKPKKRRKTPRRARSRKKAPVVKAKIPTFRRNQILLVFKASTGNGVVNQVAREYGLRPIDQTVIDILDLRLVKFSRRSALSAERALQLAGDPRVEHAQPNYVYSLTSSKYSKQFNRKQYALRKLEVEKAHKISQGKGIKIAVIDSKINKKHPVLRGAVKQEYDAIGVKTKYEDSHGTQVASIIAARNNNHMMGIAPQAQILAVRAFAKEARNGPELGETFHLLRGIDWAVKNSAQILNLSFAGPRDHLMREALERATKNGIIAVAAAGNGGPKASPAFPAAYKSVIAVTATDSKNQIYKKANRGDYITVSAPGVNILTASRKNRYALKSGTSMAAAYVSGIFALALHKTPGLDEKSVMSRVEGTAKDLGKEGPDTDYGYGLINSYRILTEDPKKVTQKSELKR